MVQIGPILPPTSGILRQRKPRTSSTKNTMKMTTPSTFIIFWSTVPISNAICPVPTREARSSQCGIDYHVPIGSSGHTRCKPAEFVKLFGRSPTAQKERNASFQYCQQLGRALACDLLRNQPHAVERALHPGLARLVILGVLVDGPHVVEPLSSEDVARGKHRRHHRVVLVVVFVHAVAADHVQRRVAALE